MQLGTIFAQKQILQKFTVCESRERGGLGTYVRTKTLKNQLVVHALCLALVLEGCRMEFEVLALDLRLSVAETRAMLRELVSQRVCFTYDDTIPQSLAEVTFRRSHHETLTPVYSRFGPCSSR